MSVNMASTFPVALRCNHVVAAGACQPYFGQYTALSVEREKKTPPSESKVSTCPIYATEINQSPTNISSKQRPMSAGPELLEAAVAHL